MIDWDVKETLNLSSVQIKGNNPRHAGILQHIGNQLGRDWFPAPRFPVLPRIAVVRQDHVDRIGTCPTQGIDHDHQFHQVIVYGS